MSILNPAASITPGFGAATVNVQVLATTCSASATTTIALPASGAFTPVSASLGYVHLRLTRVAGSPVAVVNITGTDGTTTEQLAETLTFAAMGASSNVNRVVPFITDLDLTSISVAVTLTGVSATCNADCEVAANP